MFQVLILQAAPRQETPVFTGPASSILLPGHDGEFEILDFHKPIISALKKGFIVVDNIKTIPIKRGVVKMANQSLVAIVDLADVKPGQGKASL